MGDDCDDLLHELADFLHGDMNAERRAALRTHMEACPPCFETADFQAQLRQLVARRCGEEVPAEFEARVVAMLRVEFTDPAATS